MPDQDRLRIAHLIETDGPGGAEQVVATLAGALQEHGSTNVVFVPAQGEGWLGRRLDGSGVEVDHFRLQRAVSPECVRSLAASFRRHRIAVAHSHEFSMAVYGAWAARLAHIPHVVTMHGGRYYAGRLRRRLALRSAIALSARVTTVSASVSRALCRDLGITASRVLVVPNGVRPPAPVTPTLRDELGLEPDARLVVAVGNLYPVKGHEYLLDALELMRDLHPRLHVAIAGRGDLDARLRDRARHAGLEHRVHLLGLRSDVSNVVASADVFALPSLSEGMPLALLEAMFAGRPIVASSVGDVKTALDDGQAGLLVPAANAWALAEGLDRLLTDSALASTLGATAARRAATEYHLERMVGRYEDIYHQAIGSEPSSSGGGGAAGPGAHASHPPRRSAHG